LAKKARVYDGTVWQELASAQTDLTAYSTTAQMNTAIANAGAIVPIIPTSVAVGSGSGSFNATTGNVTFTGATSISLNGVFNATYDKYIIIYKTGVTSGGVDASLRFRTSGTDNSASTYSQGIGRAMSNGTFASVNSSEGNTSVTAIADHVISNANYQTFGKLEILNPFQSFVTNGLLDFTVPNSVTTIAQRRVGAFQFNATTSFDGFSIISASALTGTIKVMAYV
jgi:hypothetical protein